MIVISPVLFLREAAGRSTAGNLLHFQIPSPASPLENSCPFPVSSIPLDPQSKKSPQERARSQPVTSAAPSPVSSSSLFQLGRSGAVPAAHPHRLGQCKTLKPCKLAGLSVAEEAQVSHRHAVRGLRQQTPMSFSIAAGAASTRCAA